MLDYDGGADFDEVRTALDWVSATYVNRFVQQNGDWIRFNDDGTPDLYPLFEDEHGDGDAYLPVARKLYFLAFDAEANAAERREQLSSRCRELILDDLMQAYRHRDDAEKAEQKKQELESLYDGNPEKFRHKVGKKLAAISSDEIQELLWKQEHPQLDDRIDDIVDEDDDFLPRMMHACGIDPRVHVATVQLMETMVQVAYSVAMHYKRGFNRVRPSQLNLELDPALLVPAHPSFPSGHSTQAHAVRQALRALFKGTAFSKLKKHVDLIARDVAENREWAGVHFESDSALGEHLAKEIWRRGIESEDSTAAVFVGLLADARKEWQ